MNKYNKRKIYSLILIGAGIATMTFAFQNFTANEADKKEGPSLYDALAAAANSAELESKEKKIALNVEPDQIEKASLRKPRNPKAIIDDSNALVESDVNWAQKDVDNKEIVEPEFDPKAEGL
ncbi:MAG: hypothetical protein IT287_01650 [Bdellovibrionaceae bacterium]|nr:hypothetical protein [Pseudobdellovibrionaceae bacterium]